MEIKEVENMLSVSRSNIRFYEKQGLLNPERCENNYRNYSEEDVAMLKKIIILRKLGFSVEEIASMQKGEIPLTDAIQNNIARLEREIETLNGALETAKSIYSEQSTFENLDEEYYWNNITQAEENGKKFIDICKDYLVFELDAFDRMCKYFFFYDFKKERKKKGVVAATAFLLILCFARGLGSVFIWDESFWHGFFYPAAVFLAGTVIMLPLYVLSKKAPRVASVIATIIFVAGMAFFAFLVLLIIGLILYSLIRKFF